MSQYIDQTEKSSGQKTLLALTVFLNFLVLFIVYLWLAKHRNVDGDEGLFLEAARLVSEGKRPYWDFFYQQMPLLPYLYAAWMEIFGFSLQAGRVLSALLTATTGLIVIGYVARSTKNLILVNVCFFFFLASGMVLAWAPVIKTHPLNMLGLTLSTLALLSWKNHARRPWWLLLISGLAIGIGINGRLTLAPYCVLFSIFILAFSRRRFRDLLLFSTAVTLPSLPSLYFLYWDPVLFYQYNLNYHTQIYPGIADGEFRLSLAQVVFVETQMLLLIALFLGGLGLSCRKGWRALFHTDQFLLTCVAGIYILVHLKTATPFTQYFSTLIPPLILGTIPLLEWVLGKKKLLALAALAPALVIYVGATNRVLNHEINSMGSDNALWDLKKLQRAVVAIQGLVRPGEPCLTWWPGYAFLAGCVSVPGMENHMRNHAVEVGIPGRVLEEYKLMSEERLLDDLKARRYRVLIAGVYRLGSPFRKQVTRALLDNYRKVRKESGVEIFVARSAVDDVEDAEILEGEIRETKRQRPPNIGVKTGARLLVHRADRE